MNGFRLLTTCGTAKADDLEAMYDTQREVSYQTILRRIGRTHLDEIFPGYRHGRPASLGQDYSVQFYRATYKGQSCYNIDWSSIDHIFTKENQNETDHDQNNSPVTPADGGRAGSAQ